jgi:Pectate lyase superfamily protein
MVQRTSEKASNLETVAGPIPGSYLVPVGNPGVESFKARKDALGGYTSVTEYRGVAGDGLTDCTTQLAQAVQDALASGAALFWPAGTYLTTASILQLHSVRHVGPGIIKRGSSLFPVEPKSTDFNRLYVSPSGSASNDGLSASQPSTLTQAAEDLANYGPVLNGTWVINLAAGTYSTNSVRFNTGSWNWVVLVGPTVGHPGVPTAILDGTGAGNNKFGFLVGSGDATSVQVWFEDIKCQNFNNGTQNSGGWALTYGAKMITVNCHAQNCDFGGIVADGGDTLLVKGGIFTNCRSGVILNDTGGTIGYQATSTADGTQFTGCTQNSVYWSRGAQGHVDYCLFTNAPYHVQIESASRAHILGCDFRTATTAAISTNTDGSYYDDVSTVNVYNDGTGNANAKRYDHFAFTGEQQKIQQVSRSWCRLFLDTTSRTLTSATKAQIGADIDALEDLLYYFTSSGTAIKVVMKGDSPAAAFSIGVDFYNAVGPTTTVMDYSASTGTPGAVGFTYECEIYPSATAVQRSYGMLSVSNLGTREQSTANTANMAIAQTVRLMGQSTSGTITVRRVEIWVMG